MTGRRPGDVVLYVAVSLAERETLQRLASRDGMSISQLLRDCLNDRLAEEGEEMPLLQQRMAGHPKGLVP